jgi:hypothetical protein
MNADEKMITTLAAEAVYQRQLGYDVFNKPVDGDCPGGVCPVLLPQELKTIHLKTN